MLYNDRLTAHFIAGELGADRAPAQYLGNIRRTADYLEVVRSIVGVPLGKVSGWRSPAHNEDVGGSDTSSHLDGLAADFTPLGITSWTAYNALKKANALGKLPAFDQIIYYPFGHLHVGLGPRMRREFRIRIAREQYALDTSSPAGPTLTSGQSDVVTIAAFALVIGVILVAILA